MKSLTDFLNEQFESVTPNVTEGTISSEKEFREAAEAKFKEVFGDELDENKMKETIDGLLADNKELVENGEWGKLIGMLNKSFA
jgi:hypothetical protein